jgi:hypothetical protein
MEPHDEQRKYNEFMNFCKLQEQLDKQNRKVMKLQYELEDAIMKRTLTEEKIKAYFRGS